MLTDIPLLCSLAFAPDAMGNYAGRTSYALPGGGSVSGTRLLSLDETGGAFSLLVVTMEPGAVLLPSVSYTETSVYYVVEGNPILSLGDKINPQVSHASKGAFVTPGVPCEVNNDTRDRVRLLILTMPLTAENVGAGAYIIGPETGNFVDMSTHRGRAIVSGKNTQGALLWLDVQTDCGAMIPPHIHTKEDETFYVVSGRYSIAAEGTRVEAGPGHIVFGPRNIAHTWRCISPEGGHLQSIITPGANFETFARTMNECGIVPARDMTNPILAAQLTALAAHHGMQMLPPAAPIK